MNRRILALVLGIATMWFASPAWAGGYVVVLRTGVEKVGSSSESTPPNEAMEEGVSTPQRSNAGAAKIQKFWVIGGSSKPTSGLVDSQVEPRLGVHYLPVVEDAAYEEAYAEFEGLNEEDLEYADVGCGGAQAASGPVGALPLLVAGLALLIRRRR